jgi:hypothetical protein
MRHDDESLEELAGRAGRGDKDALAAVCSPTQHLISWVASVSALQFARHPRIANGPIPAGTLERAAHQLDMAEAIAELYRSDPGFLAPARVWQALRKAAPDLIG